MSAAAGLELVDRLDRCLLVGFSRLGSAQTEALAATAAAFTGTPFEARLADGIAAIGRNQLSGDTLLGLALARTAVLGAVHDALLAELGRPLVPEAAAPVVPWTGPAGNLAQAVRHWLVEVAIAGFSRLEPSALLPFGATLERILEDRALARLAALLTGWHAELLAACPVPDPDDVPLRRWADLWTRAMALTVGAVHVQPEEVGGTLVPIGLEVRHHAHLVSLVAHGLLDDRPVRVGMQAWKVDVVRGAEMFDLVKPRGKALLDGFATSSAVEVTGSLANGELSVRTAAPGKPVDTAALAARLSTIPAQAVPAADRHPLLLSLPVGGSGSPAALGHRVAGWYDRSSTLTDELQAEHWVGLLRWDDGFFVQPLGAAVKAGKKLEWRSNAAWVNDRPKSKVKPVLGILRTKAGTLLRKKS